MVATAASTQSHAHQAARRSTGRSRATTGWHLLLPGCCHRSWRWSTPLHRSCSHCWRWRRLQMDAMHCTCPHGTRALHLQLWRGKEMQGASGHCSRLPQLSPAHAFNPALTADGRVSDAGAVRGVGASFAGGRRSPARQRIECWQWQGRAACMVACAVCWARLQRLNFLLRLLCGRFQGHTLHACGACKPNPRHNGIHDTVLNWCFWQLVRNHDGPINRSHNNRCMLRQLASAHQSTC